MDSKLIVFGLLAFVILCGCTRITGDDTAYKVKLGTPFQIKAGEKAVIESEKLTLRFTNVTEDSRCPEGVRCIWAGQVSVLANVDVQGNDLGNFTLTLRPGETNLSVKTFGFPYGYTVRLISADLPYGKKAGYKYDPGDYTAKFEVVSLE